MKWKHMFAFLLAVCLLAGTFGSPVLASKPGQTSLLPPAGPELVVAQNGWGTGETMDPAIDYETAGGRLLLQIYDTLVAPPRNPGEDYIPSLAAGWKVSADGLTYTFYIRSSVHFTNGGLLTPGDVAYTFRRGLLMGGSYTPQWLLFEPLMGSTAHNDITDLINPSGALLDNRAALKAADPTLRLAACKKVEQKVTYDDATSTVTFHLAQPWGPFMETLTGSWGSILDKDWVIAQGGWSGLCTNWADYYATPAADSPLANIANGTGPYNFTYVDESGNVRLDAKAHYWRTEPMWPGGPSGEPYYKTILLNNVSDATTRKNMLLDGSAQIADISGADWEEVDAQVLFEYNESTNDGTLKNPAGVLKRYPVTLPSSTDLLFNYKITKSTKYNVKNHNQFGDSIPLDFFTDIHVRKAFNYAFDWDTWIADSTGGLAVQRRGVIPKGFVGYSDSQPVFSLDLDQSAQEFALAWGGKLNTLGFTITIAYNDGNITRQRACEILKENIESISTKYQVNILALPWSEYQSDYRNQLIPLWVNGWLPDINHPHNFAFPYLTRGGVYGKLQSLPAEIAVDLETKVHECVILPISQAQTCYEELQNMSYEDVVDIWGIQTLGVNYTRAELQGYYQRVTGEIYYYAMSESPLPVVNPYFPVEQNVIGFNEPRGGTGNVVLPAGAFATEVEIAVTPGKVVGDMTSGFLFGNLTFDISAYGPDGEKLSPVFDPANPVLVVIQYGGINLAGINESTLRLRYWNGTDWEDAGCGEQVVDLNMQTLTVPLCHFSDYAMAGYPVRYLPLLLAP